MSKFIERLDKVGQETSAPLGFGTASRRDASSSNMMLVGTISSDGLSKNRGASEVEVDAIVVSLDSPEGKSIDGVVDSLKDRLWGVRVGAINEEQAAQLKEKGCDFVVFEIGETAAAVLNDEDLGKLVAVAPDLSEDLAHAIHELSIDGVLFSPEGDLLPLTIRKMVDIQMVRGLIGRHFLMAAPSNLGSSDLEVLRNAGIGGLVIDLSSTEDVSKTKEAIANLPRHKQKPRGRDAVVPQTSGGLGFYSHEDDDV